MAPYRCGSARPTLTSRQRQDSAAPCLCRKLPFRRCRTRTGVGRPRGPCMANVARTKWRDLRPYPSPQTLPAHSFSPDVASVRTGRAGRGRWSGLGRCQEGVIRPQKAYSLGENAAFAATQCAFKIAARQLRGLGDVRSRRWRQRADCTFTARPLRSGQCPGGQVQGAATNGHLRHSSRLHGSGPVPAAFLPPSPISFGAYENPGVTLC